eukprot:Clim_evm5s30 gene=Clim_evmTU5s30
MLEQVKPGKDSGVQLVHQHVKVEAPVTEQSYQAVDVQLPALWAEKRARPDPEPTEEMKKISKYPAALAIRARFEKEMRQVPKAAYEGCQVTPFSIKTESGNDLELTHTVSSKDEAKSRGVIIYFHGGAYKFGSPRSHESLICWLAYATEMDIVAPDYRMWPEYDHTAWIEDAINTYKWVIQECKVDPSKVVFSGDSAGGNLTVVAVMAIIKHNEAIKNGTGTGTPLPMPACAVPLSPWLDILAEGTSYEDNDRLDWMLGGPLSTVSVKENSFVLKKADVQAARKDPSLRNALLKDPLLSPVHAPPEWLSQLCPMLIHVSSTEIIYSDSVTFYNRARFAKCKEIILKEWPNMPHVWHAMAHILPEGVDAIQDIAKYIQGHLTAPAVFATLREKVQSFKLTRSSL